MLGTEQDGLTSSAADLLTQLVTASTPSDVNAPKSEIYRDDWALMERLRRQAAHRVMSMHRAKSDDTDAAVVSCAACSNSSRTLGLARVREVEAVREMVRPLLPLRTGEMSCLQLANEIETFTLVAPVIRAMITVGVVRASTTAATTIAKHP